MLGKEKPTAEVLARANDSGRNGEPLLVRMMRATKGASWRSARRIPGSGRCPAGPENRGRDRQPARPVLEADGPLARPPGRTRRQRVRPAGVPPAGRQRPTDRSNGHARQARRRDPGVDFKYQVVGPDEEADETKAKSPSATRKVAARALFEAKVPGEYRVVAWGEGKDANGEEIADDAMPRYVVYPEVSDEMLRPAANPEFLLALENTANGTALDAARRADRLPAFLEEMKAAPARQSRPRSRSRIPDWRRDKQKWFLPAMLVLFVAVLGPSGACDGRGGWCRVSRDAEALAEDGTKRSPVGAT